MSEYSVVGKRLPRVDALKKVTGEALFSGDIILQDMLYGKLLRSPFPHAMIRRLDVTRAGALEGVEDVITASDVPGYKKQNELSFSEMPHMAKSKVVYTEQPVAAVIATSVEIAEKAINLIEVEYEELPPALNVHDALEPDFPAIHDEMYTNFFSNPDSLKNDKPSNVAFHLKINKGDLEEGFRAADSVVEHTYETQKVHHGYIEPFASIADVDSSGKITVWTQSQGIFMARQMMASFLDIPAGRINIVPVEIGGAFGGKTYLPLAPICALSALRTGRPVRMEMTRDEVLKDSRPAPESVLTFKIGFTNEGYITAASASMLYDAGAYPEMSHAMFTSHNVLAQYRIPNVSIETKDVITNKVPSSFYRAPATPQAHLAMESLLDEISGILKMDPLQLRIRNAATEGDTLPNGETLPRVGFRETLERMAEYLKDKEEPKGKNQGRGIACGFWHGASGGFGASINVNSDGTINLILGVTDISGSRTSIAQIVAEEFHLPLEKVTVIVGDTDTAPYATMSVGSMTVYSLSAAAYGACREVKAQFSKLAAGQLEADVSEIEFEKGLFRMKTNPEKSVSFAELAKTAGSPFGKGPIMGKGTTGGVPFAPTLSVNAVDIEVDEETGKVRRLSYAAAQDVGLAINPLSIEGQIQGAVVQGIGWSLMEGYIFDKGAMQNASLLDYRIPTATDVPNIDVMIVEVGSTDGTYGLRHVGEPPMTPTLGAMTNAVHSALGVRMRELPMDPEAILKAIKEGKKS